MSHSTKITGTIKIPMALITGNSGVMMMSMSVRDAVRSTDLPGVPGGRDA